MIEHGMMNVMELNVFSFSQNEIVGAWQYQNLIISEASGKARGPNIFLALFSVQIAEKVIL